jgi:hypothetical protein
MTEIHKTLNDPAFGGPTPLSRADHAILLWYRAKGPLPTVSATVAERRMIHLGYLREIPGGPTRGWLEITENGILALTPLE